MKEQGIKVYGIENVDSAILGCLNHIDRVKAYNFSHFSGNKQAQSLMDKVLGFKKKGKKK